MATVPTKHPSKKVLRSLPTLTEVVALPDAGPVHEPDAEAIFQRVMQRLELTLDDLVRAALRDAVEGQMAALVPQVRAQVEREVRQMIAEAVAAGRQAPSGGA